VTTAVAAAPPPPTVKYAVFIAGPAVKAGGNLIGTVDGNGTAEVDTFRGLWGRDPDAVILGVTVTWYRRDDLSDPPLQWHSDLPRD
jgi:hypothetical protein